MMKSYFLTTGMLLGMLVFAQMGLAQVHETSGKNFKVVTERNAEYPGGNEAMYMFFYRNMEFPAAARDNNVTGQVTVTFDVEPDSSVSHVEALDDLGHGTQAEAIRLVKLLKFGPAIQNGKATRQHMMVSVIF